MIIMEYTPHGDLLGFMRRSRGMEDRHRIMGEPSDATREVTNYELVKFAQQVACGMQYLKSKGVNSSYQLSCHHEFFLICLKLFSFKTRLHNAISNWQKLTYKVLV